MGFTEISFYFAFLPISVVLYLLVDKFTSSDKANNILIIILNIVFYYWASKKSLVLFCLIVIFAYLAGLVMENAEKEKKKLGFAVCLS